MDKPKLTLWTILPNLHANAYRLLSSLVVWCGSQVEVDELELLANSVYSVGKHLLPHYAAVRRVITHGLDRMILLQIHSYAWTRTLSSLLESLHLSFHVLASCMRKDSMTFILSRVLPLISPPRAVESAYNGTLVLKVL